jgi:HSP20 family protein
MSIIRWHRPQSPLRFAFDRLSTLRDEIDRAFGVPWAEPARPAQFLNSWVPALDVHQNKDSVVVRAELPGLKKEDIFLTLHDGVLSLAGERKTETARTEGDTHRSERFFGKFQRSVTLPAAVKADKIQASYKDGILTVTLPKTEEAKPKQIEVSVN